MLSYDKISIDPFNLIQHNFWQFQGGMAKR